MLFVSFSRSVMRHALLCAACTLTIALPARIAFAQQIVAFDVTYTASAQTTMDAHFDVPPPANLPANWVSPTDYSNGTVYIHQEVFTKPSNLDTQVDVCFDGDLPGYGCISTNLYKTTGTHETVAPLKTMWQYGMVAWTKKRTLFQLIVKDANNNNGGLPMDQYMPTMMRMVLTVVAPGGTYVPPSPSTVGLSDGGSGGDDGAADAASETGALVNGDAAAATEAGPALPDATTGTSDDASSSVPPSPADAASPPPSGTTGSDAQPTTGTPTMTATPAGASGGCSLGRTTQLGGEGTALPLAIAVVLAGARRRRKDA